MSRRISDLGFRTSKPPSKPYGKSLICVSFFHLVKQQFTAVVKKVVGTHYFLAIFGPIGAHFSSHPLRQPHGIKVSHIVKLNRAVP